MSENPSNTESGAADRCRSPQGSALNAAPLSRLVIRDKRSENPPPNHALKAPAFDDKPTETPEFVSFGNGQGIVITHPIPDTSASPYVAHVDWLGFSLVPPDGKALEWLFDELRRLFDIWMIKPRPGGWMGYKQSASLGDFGLVAWGGKHQRGTVHVEINGTGCSQVKSWAAISAWGNALDARITRVDLAHDDFKSEICSLVKIVEWHEAGGFNSGGRTPKLKHAGDFTDYTDGGTLYVGTRGNKVLRCYEKGKQLGFPNSPWFRVELELKNKNRVIEWETLEVPGQFLAGAYPCLSYLSAIQCKTRTTQKAAAMSLKVMTDNAARLSGKAINVLMRENGEDAELVVSKLRREGIPKRLAPYKQGLGVGSQLDENP